MSDLNTVRTDVEILKKDVSNIQGLLGRLDIAIDKIADATNGISQILAVHETEIKDTEASLVERKRLAEKEVDLLHKRISEKDAENKETAEFHHNTLMTFLKEHDDRSEQYITKMNDRITQLERWKWVMLGGASVVGFLIAKMEYLLPAIQQ
jgi:chromosome segregation ATPase